MGISDMQVSTLMHYANSIQGGSVSEHYACTISIHVEYVTYVANTGVFKHYT
jgi:hypothetical protein